MSCPSILYYVLVIYCAISFKKIYNDARNGHNILQN